MRRVDADLLRSVTENANAVHFSGRRVEHAFREAATVHDS
jgi:hypothetical protein